VNLYCPFCAEEIAVDTIECPSCGTVYDANSLKYLTAASQGTTTLHPPHERRRHLRARISLKVTYFSAKSFVSNYIFNLSAGGLFIKTKNPLSPGEKLKLKIFLPDKQKELELFSEVIWIRKEEQVTPKGTYPPGMGVKFLNPSTEDIKRIISVLSQSMK
jgi:type IV pilus assembly protein PilZ